MTKPAPKSRSRSHRGTPLTTYTWEGVPRQLIADAIAKGRAADPPVTLKRKLIDLLTAWVREA